MSFSSQSVEGDKSQHSIARSKASSNPELARQFASLMKQNQDLEHDEAVEETTESDESSDVHNLKKTQTIKRSTALDNEPSLPTTIHRIQRQLTRLSKSTMSKERLADLKDHAQSRIDEMKKEGYKLKDLELPDEGS